MPKKPLITHGAPLCNQAAPSQAGQTTTFRLGECHAHLALDGLDYQAAALMHRAAPHQATLCKHFEAYRARGVSFVRDCGDAWGVSIAARDLAAEYGITYLTPAFALHKQGHYGSIVGRAFATLKDYATLVEEAASEGAHFIKIMTTGIMDFTRYGELSLGETLSAAEVREMVHIAHEQGFAVAAHANGAQAVLDALEAGADSIEHGNSINDEGLQALLATGAVLVPTANVSLEHLGSAHGDDEVVRRIAARSEEVIQRAFEQGVSVALGSDAGAAGVLHGEGTLREYEFFKRCITEQVALDTWLEQGQARIEELFGARVHG